MSVRCLRQSRYALQPKIVDTARSSMPTPAAYRHFACQKTTAAFTQQNTAAQPFHSHVEMTIRFIWYRNTSQMSPQQPAKWHFQRSHCVLPHNSRGSGSHCQADCAVDTAAFLPLMPESAFRAGITRRFHHTTAQIRCYRLLLPQRYVPHCRCFTPRHAARVTRRRVIRAGTHVRKCRYRLPAAFLHGAC